MKYAFLIYEDEAKYGPDKAGPAIQQIVAEHITFNEGLGAKRVAGGGLKGTATATTIQTKDGRKIIHDGPFAEAREQLGGFYVIEAADLDEAIMLGRQIPILGEGSVEIRPLLGQ